MASQVDATPSDIYDILTDPNTVSIFRSIKVRCGCVGRATMCFAWAWAYLAVVCLGAHGKEHAHTSSVHRTTARSGEVSASQARPCYAVRVWPGAFTQLRAFGRPQLPFSSRARVQECTYRNEVENDGKGRRKLEIGHRALARFLFINITFVSWPHMFGIAVVVPAASVCLLHCSIGAGGEEERSSGDGLSDKRQGYGCRLRCALRPCGVDRRLASLLLSRTSAPGLLCSLQIPPARV